MPHLLFDFNRVLLFPKRSIPVDMILSMTAHLAKKKAGSDNLFTHHMLDFDHYFEFNEPLIQYLQTLKDEFQIPIHVYTNSTHSIHAPKAQSVIEPLVDHIFLAKNLGKPKDLPASYLYVAEELEAKPEELLFIDDTLGNVEAASQAGLHTHHFTENEALFAALESFLDVLATS